MSNKNHLHLTTYFFKLISLILTATFCTSDDALDRINWKMNLKPFDLRKAWMVYVNTCLEIIIKGVVKTSKVTRQILYPMKKAIYEFLLFVETATLEKFNKSMSHPFHTLVITKAAYTEY